MTLAELITELQQLAERTAANANTDPEDDHREADKLLLAFINDEQVTQAFSDIEKWYA